MSDRISISVAILGSEDSGKTSLLLRWLYPSRGFQYCSDTVGIEMTASTIKFSERLQTLKFWDTSGREMYDSLLDSYIYNSTIVALVFDVGKKKSWEKVDFWLNKIRKKNGKDHPVIIIGNKIDEECYRKIHKIDVMTYIRELDMNNVIYEECSAKSGENVINVYKVLVRHAQTAKPPIKIWRSIKATTDDNKCTIV